MPLATYAIKTRTGERLARLPLTPEGEFGTTISTYSAASFSLDINDKECPDNWADYVEPHLMSIVVCDDRDEPIWLGMINDTPITSGGNGVKIPCASLEWGLDNRYPADHTFPVTSDYMAIPRALLADVEAGGVGFGLAVDAPDCGTARAYTIKRSDGKSVATILDEIGLEWTIALAWADENRDRVIKTFTAREPNLGTVIATPEMVITYPGNADSWSFTAPMTEGKTATYVQALGDGTGDLRTTSLPKIDTAREAAGYPRIEHLRTFSGVTNVNDANALADQISQDLFTRRHVITLTVLNSGATGFAKTSLGSSVRITIDAPELQLDEVWRFVGWTMAADGVTWSPTLAKLGTKVKDFPRANDASTLGRILRDLGKPVSTDPLANGYTFPLNGDKAYAIDPSLGFGSYDANGVFTPFATGGSGGELPWNPGSGGGSGYNPGWEWGSEGRDPDSTYTSAEAFEVTERQSFSPVGAVFPSCQNEGNLVFGATTNTYGGSRSYTLADQITYPMGWEAGAVDIWSGYLQGGRLMNWGQVKSNLFSQDLMASILLKSPITVRPADYFYADGFHPYYVTGTQITAGGFPFTVGGWLYLPVIIGVTWSSGGYGAPYYAKTAVHFLKASITSYTEIGAFDPVLGSHIFGDASQVTAARSGSRIVVHVWGSNTSSLYSAEFDGLTGNLGPDSWYALPAGPTNAYAGMPSFAKSTSGIGISIYCGFGELELGNTIKPRTETTAWIPKNLQNLPTTTVAGRTVTIVMGGSPPVGAAVLDSSGSWAPIGAEGLNTGNNLIGHLFSYDGYVYGVPGGSYSASWPGASAKFTPLNPV